MKCNGKVFIISLLTTTALLSQTIQASDRYDDGAVGSASLSYSSSDSDPWAEAIKNYGSEEEAIEFSLRAIGDIDEALKQKNWEAAKRRYKRLSSLIEAYLDKTSGGSPAFKEAIQQLHRNMVLAILRQKKDERLKTIDQMENETQRNISLNRYVRQTIDRSGKDLVYAQGLFERRQFSKAQEFLNACKEILSYTGKRSEVEKLEQALREVMRSTEQSVQDESTQPTVDSFIGPATDEVFAQSRARVGLEVADAGNNIGVVLDKVRELPGNKLVVFDLDETLVARVPGMGNKDKELINPDTRQILEDIKNQGAEIIIVSAARKESSIEKLIHVDLLSLFPETHIYFSPGGRKSVQIKEHIATMA